MGHGLQVVLVYRALLAFIEADELPLKGLQLVLSRTQPGDEGEHNLLKLAKICILDQILLNFKLLGFVVLVFELYLTDPWMVEQLGDAWSRDLVAVKTLENKIFGMGRDGAPLFVGKLYLFSKNILVDSLYFTCIKRRAT